MNYKVPRYIKTRDHILPVIQMFEIKPEDVEVKNFDCQYECRVDVSKTDSLKIYVKKKDVIAEGDTMEELCDCFRYINKVNPSYKRLYDTLDDLINCESEIDSNLCTIYGCIENDDGINYVCEIKLGREGKVVYA